MKRLLLLGAIILLSSCQSTEKELTAAQIIEKAIENAGGTIYDNAEVDFTFRNIQYKSVRQGGKFSLQRILPDTLNTIDIVTNDGFTRLQKSVKVNLPDSVATKYNASVNSVHYFLQLPYGLNDDAVQKELLGTSTIKGKEYYKIEVTFAEEGGGEDHEDIFLYWISKDNFTVDYLAYQFFTEEGGIRFRESYNPRVIEGIRFVDYKNYKPKQKEADFYNIEKLYESGELVELSLIENTNISVRVLN